MSVLSRTAGALGSELAGVEERQAAGVVWGGVEGV